MASRLSALGFSSRALSHAISSGILCLVVSTLLRDADGDGDVDQRDVLAALDADADGSVGAKELAWPLLRSAAPPRSNPRPMAARAR